MKTPTRKICRLLLGFSLALLACTAQAADDLAQMQSKFDSLYGEGVLVVAPTPFSGIYSYYPKAAPNEAGGRLTTADMALTANDGFKGWVNRTDHSPAAPEVVATLRRDAAMQLATLNPLLVIKKGAPVSMMIYSAVDCSACLTLEKYLSKSGFSYGVFPTALADSRLEFAEEVYCHKTPQLAWTQLMLKRELLPLSPKANCAYPAANIKTVGSMFGKRSTPTIIFADGSLGPDAPETLEEQRAMTALIRDKVRQGIVFKMPP